MLGTIDDIRVHNTALEEHFASKLKVNHQLNRSLVSFQANKNRPGYRWFKYKEGFSEALVHYVLDHLGISSGKILDPFAGTGTVLFVSRERGLDALGIELLPVGCEVMEVRKSLLGDETEAVRAALARWRSVSPWKSQERGVLFPHLRITQGAFPDETEHSLECYLSALESESGPAARILRFAALCILEEISYTRKDGQYLRWDYRSGRRQGSRPFDKGPIPSFERAIQAKLGEIEADLRPYTGTLDLFPAHGQQGSVEIVPGSCLEILPGISSASMEGLITSPPYCNRYDYTRTYALELALLGVGEEGIRHLRQEMVSCTVENRAKVGLNTLFSDYVYRRALVAFDGQRELHAILNYLDGQKEAGTLNNSRIPRMVRNYFWEMALVIFECARILKPGAPLVMVNDNVRYGGVTIPVDLILSDMAEQAGFEVEVIWVLPRGKGNSSQQMGAHGREELRKCIYIWRKLAGS